MPLRKSLRERIPSWKGFQWRKKCPILGGKKKKTAKRTFISKKKKKKRKWAPRIKVGKDKLTLLVCANATAFMIRNAFIYKDPNPRALKEKDKHQVPVFCLYNNRKAWKMITLLLNWFHWFFVPEVSKRLLFKVLLILDNDSSHPELHGFDTRHWRGLLFPKRNVFRSTSRSGGDEDI